MGLDWISNTVNFIAGAGDSLSFGGTKWVRDYFGDAVIGGPNPVSVCETSYKAGEYSEIAAELLASLGSSTLKQLAKGASRSAADRFVLKNFGGGMHHINPLRGHPIGIGIRNLKSLFPTIGLPIIVNSGSLNLARIGSEAAHNAAHLRL